MVQIEYDQASNILQVELKGRIELEEMMASCSAILKNITLPRSLKILEDATDAIFNFDIEEMEQINRLIEDKIGNFQGIKHAMLRDKPLETAYGIMLEELGSSCQYHPKVFTTLQGAKSWLHYH